MEVSILVTNLDAMQTIEGHQFYFKFCRRRYILGDDFIQVLIHEFKDEV